MGRVPFSIRQAFGLAITVSLIPGCSGSSQVTPGRAPTLTQRSNAQPYAQNRSPRASDDSIVHFFSGSPDGASPSEGRLTSDASGNLYGATLIGGTGRCTYRGVNTGCGTVFELTPMPSGSWSEHVIYSFKDGTDGARPYGTVTPDANGNVFGVTIAGGNSGCVPLFWAHRGCGIAFELRHDGARRWTKHVLHVFSGGGDGGNPLSGLVLDPSGKLYGTTYCGGVDSCYTEGEGFGVFFALTPNKDGSWSEKVIHAFGRRRSDDAYPVGDLTPDGTTIIYGSTVGSVYEMRRSSPSSQWRESTLFAFGNNSSQGRNAQGGIAIDTAGNLYGTTYSGGNSNCRGNGCGVVFALTRSPSGHWTETVLHAFTGEADGAFTDAGLAIDATGRLYGTTSNGGDLTCNNGGGCGVAFALRPHGSASKEQVLHTFEDDATDGGMPTSAVILDRAGNIYGTTMYGGPGPNLGKGTAFEIARFAKQRR